MFVTGMFSDEESDGYSIFKFDGYNKSYFNVPEIEKILGFEIDDSFLEKHHCNTYWDFDNAYFHTDGECYLIFKREKTAQKFLTNILIPNFIANKLVKGG